MMVNLTITAAALFCGRFGLLSGALNCFCWGLIRGYYEFTILVTALSCLRCDGVATDDYAICEESVVVAYD